jgi:hypothetical protein
MRGQASQPPGADCEHFLPLQKKPFASTEDIEARVVPQLTPEMKTIFEKYKKNLVALKAAPEVGCAPLS